MLVATFGDTTAWVGKTIAFENDQFILGGYGPITPRAIVGYDEQGHLEWSSDGLRRWVYELATAMTPSSPPPDENSTAEAAQSASSSASRPRTDASAAQATATPAIRPKVTPIAVFSSATGWAGKTITQEGSVFMLEDFGPISPEAVMGYDKQGQLTWATSGTRAWIGSLGSTPVPFYPPGAADAVPAPVQQTAAGTSLSSTLLWIVAFSPLWLSLLLVMAPTRLAFYILPFALLMWDRDNVRKAGVEIKGLLLWAILFAPVYMYIRLRRTNQSLGPFIASLPCFALSSIIGLTAIWRAIWG